MTHLRARSQWPLDDRLTVVLFAGYGGSCDGLEAAGHPVHVAGNHDAWAIAAHRRRHPHVRHLQADVLDLCPRTVTGGRPVKILWLSPDCRHFSPAKGSAPVSPRVRSLPWVACRWAGQARPEVIFAENVMAIRTWGPLIAKRDKVTGRVLKLDGAVAAPGERVPVQDQQLVPDPRRKGRTYRRWIAHIQSLGFHLETRDLCCADYGVPTTRTRFFMVGRSDGRPVVWPERTHAPREVAAGLGLLPWVPAATVIDWTRPMRSIFGRARPLAEMTLRRVAKGVVRFVLEAAEPFLIPVTHGGDARAHDIGEPLRTVTTAHRGEFALVAPSFATFYGSKRPGDHRCHDPAEPLPTQTTENRFAVVASFLEQHNSRSVGQPLSRPLGTVTTSDHHALVGAWLPQHNSGLVGHGLGEPVSTIVTKGCTQGLAAAHLVKLRGTARDGQDLHRPLPTITAGGNHAGLVAGFLAKYYGSAVGQGLDQPLHTVTVNDRHALVTVPIAGETYVLADILMRMLEPEEAAAAHQFKGPIPGELVIDGQVRRVPKDRKMAWIGNSVPPRMAELLSRLNVAPALAPAEAAE